MPEANIETMMSTKPKIADFILIGIIFIAAVALILIPFLPQKEAATVEIYVDGKLFLQTSITQSASVSVDGHMTVVIEDGIVFVEDSDCPNGLCVKTGKISASGQSIICLPNRIFIKILGESEVDAVVG